MAAKRLNIKFVIIFVSLLVGLALGALLVLHIQSSRQITQSYQMGLAAFDEGDMEKARVHLGHVADKLTDHEEQIEATRKLAFAYVDLLEQPNKSHRDIEICRNVLDKALQLDPVDIGQDRIPLKEAYAKCQLLMAKPGAAAQTYIELANEFPDNPQYLLSASDCYVKNKDSKAADTLSKLVSRHLDFIPGWIAYARYYQEIGQMDLAMQNLNSMVDSNPDSAQAYAQRALFLYAHPEMGEMALAEESAVNALRLGPNNLDALLAATKMYTVRKKFEQAHECFEKAVNVAKSLEDRKNDQRVVEIGIQLADAEGKPESALELLQTDVQDDPQNITKRLSLFQRLIILDKMEEAQKEINNLRQVSKLSLEALGFFEAIIEIREEKWASAIKKLEQARAFMGQQPEMLAYIDRQRALCYGKLGQIDKQFEAFQKAVQNVNEATCVPFYLAYIHALHSAGRIPQMEEVLTELMDKIGQQKFMEYHELRTLYFALRQQKEALKPKDEQNWEAIHSEMSDNNMNANNPEGILLSVRMLVKQEKINDAKELLNRAINEHPNTIAFISYLALLEAQEKNFEKAIEIVDRKLEEKKGNPGLLITKIRVLSQMKTDDAALLEDISKQFKEIEELAYRMPDNIKLTVLKQLAMGWLQFENIEEADRIYSSIIQFEPENVGIKIQLFDLARKSDNEQKMNAQMERIRREVGTNSPEYRYCLATKDIWEYSKKKDSPEKLRSARENLEVAQQIRPSWVYIPRALAEIAILEKDYAAAITHLYRVDQVGTLTTQQLNLLIRLLYLESRDPEVKQLIARKREANLAADAAMMSVEALANSGEGDEAVRRGSEIIDTNNPKDHLWIGHIALRAKDYRKAEEAFRKVTEIAPENPNGWLSLLQVQKIQAMDVSKEEFIANVQKAVPPEKLPLCLAKAYQLFGEAKEAEKTFLEAVKLEPENLEVLFSISQFYMCTTHPEMAISYLKKMSELISEDKRLNVETKGQQLAWTRRSLAQIYAGMPNYELQTQGLQLVEENLSRQPDSLDDLKVKALLLTARRNPEDNQRAIEIYDSIPTLANRELFNLAKLYFEQSFNPDGVAMKEKFRSVMTELVSANENNTEYLSEFIEMLIAQNAEVDTIASYIDRLTALNAESSSVFYFRARLFLLQKDTDGLKEYIASAFPKKVEQKDILPLLKCASTLEVEGMNEEASTVWEKLIAAEPKLMELFMMSQARQNGIGNALAYLQANQAKIEPVLQLNLLVRACRHSKKTVTREEYKQIKEYVDLLFRDKADSLELQVFNAKLLELQGKFDEAVAIYNSLLEKPFEASQMASIEFALAQLLALTGKDIDRAIALIDEAVQKFPNDITLRDTRALVYMRSKERTKTDQAMDDLKYVLVMKDDPMFHFHLAVLYWNRANVNAARIAFEKAKRLDPFLIQNISALEVPDFTELSNNLQ
ncbi:MAG: tetratricopeptide repeat protein [Thermoguttaceae bacterium]|nr:tetratricopeptide repeat protein [Thermoguttaceae bacterium]